MAGVLLCLLYMTWQNANFLGRS